MLIGLYAALGRLLCQQFPDSIISGDSSRHNVRTLEVNLGQHELYENERTLYSLSNLLPRMYSGRTIRCSSIFQSIQYFNILRRIQSCEPPRRRSGGASRRAPSTSLCNALAWLKGYLGGLMPETRCPYSTAKQRFLHLTSPRGGPVAGRLRGSRQNVAW